MTSHTRNTLFDTHWTLAYTYTSNRRRRKMKKTNCYALGYRVFKFYFQFTHSRMLGFSWSTKSWPVVHIRTHVHTHTHTRTRTWTHVTILHRTDYTYTGYSHTLQRSSRRRFDDKLSRRTFIIFELVRAILRQNRSMSINIVVQCFVDSRTKTP